MKRPGWITLLCLIGFITVVLTFPQMFSPPVKKLGNLVPALYGVLVASLFIASIGLWHYKQWGALLFLITLFVKLAFYILTDTIESGFYIHAFMLILASVVLWRHFVKMDANL